MLLIFYKRRVLWLKICLGMMPPSVHGILLNLRWTYETSLFCMRPPDYLAWCHLISRAALQGFRWQGAGCLSHHLITWARWSCNLIRAKNVICHRAVIPSPLVHEVLLWFSAVVHLLRATHISSHILGCRIFSENTPQWCGHQTFHLSFQSAFLSPLFMLEE